MLRIAGALILVAAVAAFVAAPRWFPASQSKSPAQAARAPVVATTTDGPALWPELVPERVSRAGKRPAVRPERTEEQDWKGLSLGIAAAGSPARETPIGAPAIVDHGGDLVIDLSREERRALIAQAREPDVSVAPAGYVPGIVVLTAGGGHGDGICR
jgi:hypothetical protein